jgi:hypothetical protein
MAEWTTAYKNDLPDSAFACIRGKERFYPHHDSGGKLDLPHLRAALSRVGDTSNEQCGKAHLQAHADAEGMGKAMMELKAEPFTTGEMDRWLAGKIPRRILVAPFGGPLAKAKGLDLDGEYFDEQTDFYGPYPELKASRDRLVDFHHTTFLDRKGTAAEDAVKGAIMGRVVLDDHFEEPDWGFAGLWGDFWANAGEKRRSLIAYLEGAGHQLYGSTQPIAGGVRRGKAGHIDVWPIQYHTISTSPQNTYAIVPPLKAALDASDITVGALRALAAEFDALGSLHGPSDTGDHAAKTGRMFSRRNEGDISSVLEEFEAALERVRDILRRGQAEENLAGPSASEGRVE